MPHLSELYMNKKHDTRLSGSGDRRIRRGLDNPLTLCVDEAARSTRHPGRPDSRHKGTFTKMIYLVATYIDQVTWKTPRFTESISCLHTKDNRLGTWHVLNRPLDHRLKVIGSGGSGHLKQEWHFSSSTFAAGEPSCFPADRCHA